MTSSIPPNKPPAEVHPMQALLEQAGYDMPQRGDIREGTVLSVTPQEIVIDLGLKREGVVPANDLARLDKDTIAEIQEGTVWPVYILQPSDREGNLIVSIARAIQEKDWLVAQQMMDDGEIFEGSVSGHNSGGLEVVFGKLRGFVPASHISTLPRNAGEEERQNLLASYVGQTIPLKVVEVDRRRRRLILSERAAHRRWQREHRKQLLDEIQVGEVRSGIVRSLANFGAFVDIGGADGLIHISEVAWFPVNHPGEVLKVGDKVDVKVLRVDRAKERVGLSLKRTQPDPWESVEDDYKVNELVEAVVTRVTDFGAFVRLQTGVEGLLHVSEMADIRPDHPQSLVTPNDLLLLRVIRVEAQRRRIGLSLRQVSEAEWSSWAASYREQHALQAEEEIAEALEAAEAEAEIEELEAEAAVEDLAVAALIVEAAADSLEAAEERAESALDELVLVDADASASADEVVAAQVEAVEALEDLVVAEAEAEIASEVFVAAATDAAIEVAEAEDAVERLEEIAEAAAEIEAAEEEIAAEALAESAEAEAELEVAEAEAVAEELVESAETEAELEVAEAEAVAEELVESAEAEAEIEVAEAEAVAEELVESAEAEAEIEVVEAEAVAEELVESAETEAEAIEAEAVAEELVESAEVEAAIEVAEAEATAEELVENAEAEAAIEVAEAEAIAEELVESAEAEAAIEVAEAEAAAEELVESAEVEAAIEVIEAEAVAEELVESAEAEAAIEVAAAEAVDEAEEEK